MAKAQHPSSLNLWQRYRQASSILKTTSRASNPAWYQQALDLDLQLHIRPDGADVFTSYYNRTTDQWSPGPKVSDEILSEEDSYQTIFDEILATAKTNKAPAIGVVFHIADEFATAELKPELDNPAALPELRDSASKEPQEILEDGNFNADESSCRIIPYAAAGSESIGTAVTISHQHAPFLNALHKFAEKINYPIITQSVSAPLVAITGLPGMMKGQPDKPFVSILQYPWFTVLAFFNEHADLKLIRTLQHRGVRQASNLRNALFTTSASLEFLDPDLYILPLGEQIDDELSSNLSQNFANSQIDTIDMPQEEGIPTWCSELIIANQDPKAGAFSSMTFTSLGEDQWAFQDFLPMPREMAEIYPDKGEMAMLRITRLVRLFVAVLALGGIGYFGLGMWNLMKLPEWSFDPGAANNAQAKLGQLNAEQRRITHWSNLLQDRSKAWMVMESFARMFPAESNTLISDMTYSCKPENSQGQTTVGIVKAWKISGFARDQAIEYLNQLNTRDGINNHFNNIAEITGNDGFRTDIGNRNISVNIRTRENNSFRPIPVEEAMMTDTTTYPFTFDLTITQRFEATDPMAISVRKAP